MVFPELALVGGLLIGGILWFTEGPRFRTASHILRNDPPTGSSTNGSP
jgi:hypothetical protein